mmetsp:Transcript_32311/g.49134  ORF Transcript_32311/g.49134 Transcript_32311/m.49134 type:complete len:732 (-) Transcript_32311:196-2391(-)
MTDNKASLMASLTGEAVPETEQDLFGEIPIENPFVPSETPQPVVSVKSQQEGQLIVDNPSDIQENNPLSLSVPVQTLSEQQQPASQAVKRSLLADSGLLGHHTLSNGDGGLFDEVDKEEEERFRREAELKKQKEEEERKRLADEQLRQQQEEENLRRQAEEQMMQTVSLANSVAVYPQQQQYPPQQQHASMINQGLTNQMQNMSMSTPNPSSFAERSQMMQQQAVTSHHLIASQTASMHQPTGNSDPFSPSGFYRPDPNMVQTNQPSMMQSPAQPNIHYANPGGNAQTNLAASSSRLPQAPSPSITAGLHNANSGIIGRRPPVVVQPTAFEPIHGQVTVSEPLLVQPPSLFNVVPPHWTYQIQTSLKEGGCWLVRRRFSHIVALEERMRCECAGAILSPRPDKHATRAIEEASTMQSAEFAMQRAAEIQVYLNALVCHPHAGKSSSLKLFLALQDDMGTAWAEVSANALTRMGAVSGAAVQNVTEKQMPWDSNAQDALEDDAELLALSNSEGIRMGAVVQAVPKLEGSITLLREHGECAGAVGMEMGKLSKAVEGSDRDLGVPIDVLSQGLLRYGRRQRRLALELSAAMNPFINQYKLCKYEKMAFEDRRTSLQKRVKERGRADFRAQRLMMNQRTLNGHGAHGDLDRLEREASYSDEVAVGAVHQSDIICSTVKSEVNRVAFERRTEWSKSMKVLCSALREASAENASIWEASKESFLQAFPEYNAGTVE